MKKALILTYYWPPGSGPGVQRWLKFAKYLPENGWQPIVITVKNGSYPSRDESLLTEVPEDLKVIRTKTFEPFGIYNLLRGKKGKSVEVGMGNLKGNKGWLNKLANYVRSNFFIPDARVGWNRYSFPEAIKVILAEKPDVIITTGPPHSTHLVGERLHNMFGIPWVADLRDPWTTIYYNEFLNRSNRSKKQDKKLENRVIQSATHVITASPGINKEFEQFAKGITMIPNGFDDDDFEHEKPKANPIFTLAYIGNLKVNQNTVNLWKALAIINQNDRYRGKFKLQIVGNINSAVLQEMNNQGISGILETNAFVAHLDAIKYMKAAHVLLLPVPMSENNKGILTGKIFEYLATKRPILSIGPIDGNAAQILSECGKSPMIEYADLDTMTAQITGHLDEFLIDPTQKQDGNDAYLRFSRKGTTAQLSALLGQIAPS